MNTGTPARGLEGVRILEITQRYPPALGGVERHVERLAFELAQAGAYVDIVTTDLSRDRPFTRGRFAPVQGLATVRRHRAVQWFRGPHGLGIAAPGMLLDALRARADIVHAHAFGYFPTWAGRLTRDLRGIPLVITPHSDRGAGTSLSYLYARTVARATLRRADRVVAVTRLEAHWLGSLGVDSSRIQVIPNGIDLTEFEARPPRRESDGGPRILYVGRIYPEQKGLESLVEAFALLPRPLDARLRLVGEDWGGLARLERIARDLGVAGRMNATGPIPRRELLSEYASSDLFVLPSLFEPFGIVLLEAMAAGLPVVATRVGGIPEVVEENRTAILVSPGNPAELARAINRCLSDRMLSARLGSEGRRRVEQFAWPRLVPAYVQLVSNVISAERA
jgi:glycosyltransferase involved in cell wall biosynthesis